MDHTDVVHLRRCLDLARTARDGGNVPFGSLLVGGDGSVLAELMNTSAPATRRDIPSWHWPRGRHFT